MSPEQLVSSKDVDARTDIGALGVIPYELLSGRRSFEAETMPEIVGLILRNEPERTGARVAGLAVVAGLAGLGIYPANPVTSPGAERPGVATTTETSTASPSASPAPTASATATPPRGTPAAAKPPLPLTRPSASAPPTTTTKSPLERGIK